MKYKFLDLKKINEEYRKDFHLALDEVLDSGYYIRGQATEKFEEEFARYCGAKYCVTVGNGLDALTLVLKAWGIGSGDEVIVPSNTFIATWLAVTSVGATIVPVDPNWDTYNIEASSIEEKITKKTKVIIPVHLYGQPVDLDPIISLANKYDLRILEDAAQAHGAIYKNKRVGSHGNPVAFSFYPGKNLGALGDAGAVVTDDFELVDRIKTIANYGSRQKYIHDYLGINSRMDDIQAAFLSVKLSTLDFSNQHRQEIAAIYAKHLDKTAFNLPVVLDSVTPVWHLFVLRHVNRGDVQNYLMSFGIETLIHYPKAIADQGAYSKFKFQESTRLSSNAGEIFSLPIGPHLTMKDAEQIATILKEFQD